MRTVKHIILWITSMILFTMASFGMEFLEGNNIGTSEYYGLRNMGFIFIVFIFLYSSVLYPILLLVSWVFRKIANPFIGRVVILLLGGIGGYALFHLAYDDRFVHEYNLNSSTAIIVFGIAASLYILVDYYFDRHANKFDDKY